MRPTGPGAGCRRGIRGRVRRSARGSADQINVDYFRYLDKIIAVLVEHGLTPVLQPVFHGFGWKGLTSPGRSCRRRSTPATAATSSPGTAPGRRSTWSAPTDPAPSLRSRPAASEVTAGTPTPSPPGALPAALAADAHQAAPLARLPVVPTGHEGDHVPDRVATMWGNSPAKAIMNGEPTYEEPVRPGKAPAGGRGTRPGATCAPAGRWGSRTGPAASGSGGSPPTSPATSPLSAAGAGWREALAFEGSRYVGLVGKILDGLPRPT